jgi:hypothetical protein
MAAPPAIRTADDLRRDCIDRVPIRQRVSVIVRKRLSGLPLVTQRTAPTEHRLVPDAQNVALPARVCPLPPDPSLLLTCPSADGAVGATRR